MWFKDFNLCVMNIYIFITYTSVGILYLTVYNQLVNDVTFTFLRSNSSDSPEESPPMTLLKSHLTPDIESF